MQQGTILQTGTAEELYYAPSTRWAAEFVGAANLVRGTLAGGWVKTPIGSFPATGENGSERVDALVRPELLELEPDPAGPAVVVRREFRGHDVFYALRLDDGTTLCAQRPSTEAVPIGCRVSLRPHARPVAHFARPE
jgi:ABC-type Fe3+/spermidine/putrescine transport system ATPase subunit